jgi:hypothetical protein
MCVFRHRRQCPATHAGRQERQAAKGRADVNRPFGGLPRCVAFLGERAADALASIDHVVGLFIARGVASIIAEAGALQELSELPGLGIGEDDE